MILFALHAAIAILTAYVVLSKAKKTALFPLAGILALFVFHCLYFRESCLSCVPENPVCAAEILAFWFLAAWAILSTIVEERAKKL